MCMSMAFMPMPSRPSVILCGGIGAIARMAGGDIPIMAGAGTVGMVPIGAMAGAAGTVAGMPVGMTAGTVAGDTQAIIIIRAGDTALIGAMQ